MINTGHSIVAAILFALISALIIGARRYGSPWQAIIKVTGWFSLILMAISIPLSYLGWTLSRWSLSPAQRAAECDVCPGEEWFYAGITLFAAGGISQLIPITLGLIAKCFSDRHGRAEGQ